MPSFDIPSCRHAHVKIDPVISAAVAVAQGVVAADSWLAARWSAVGVEDLAQELFVLGILLVE